MAFIFRCLQAINVKSRSPLSVVHIYDLAQIIGPAFPISKKWIEIPEITFCVTLMTSAALTCIWPPLLDQLFFKLLTQLTGFVPSLRHRSHQNNALMECEWFFSTLPFVKFIAKFHSLKLKRHFWRQTKHLHFGLENFWLYSSIFWKKNSLKQLFYRKFRIAFNCFDQCISSSTQKYASYGRLNDYHKSG